MTNKSNLEDATVDHVFQTANSAGEQEVYDGTCVGIDLGTSNSTCAIWDSTRGRPKCMRLEWEGLASPKRNSQKPDTIVPSSFLLDEEGFLQLDQLKIGNTSSPLSARVGHTAVRRLHDSMMMSHETDSSGDCKEDVSASLVTSVKRVLGVCDTMRLVDLDESFRKSLPFELEENENGQWCVSLRKAGLVKVSAEPVLLRPIQIVAAILLAIRLAAQNYLDENIEKKSMTVPCRNKTKGVPSVNNCVIGVPAYFGRMQREQIELAARMAGFANVATIAESTAAAMAYGLFVSAAGNRPRTIIVLDIGGGTTDITIAEVCESPESSAQFQVVVTEGDGNLGGDDIDEAILRLVLSRLALSIEQITPADRQTILQSCKRLKERLCGDMVHGIQPESSSEMTFKGSRVEVTQQEFDRAIDPFIEQARHLIVRSTARYAEAKGHDTTGRMEEVILIGGTTRVPAIRRMVREVFPPPIPPDLCSSVDAMTAVAQGASIQAAIRSGAVPLHELRSAMMLDTTPHAIGVLVGKDSFCEILCKDQPLPAKGYATFSLEDSHQRGVTIEAVEQVGGETFQKVGTFTFLLHRLSEDQRKSLSGNARTVDIGMTLGTDGEFRVSVFDPLDPDHIRKRNLLQKYRNASKETENNILVLTDLEENTEMKRVWSYLKEAIGGESLTAEECRLMVLIFSLLVLYIAVKMALSDPLEAPETDMQ